jgi:two-component system KDP operon response regulator KdpE
MSMSKGVAVLIVDDEPPIRRFLRSSLAAEGCRVFEAEDAEGALRRLAVEKPDVGLPPAWLRFYTVGRAISG